MTLHPRESRYGRPEFLEALRGRPRRPVQPEHAPRGLRRWQQRRVRPARAPAREPGQPGDAAALRRQPDDRVRARPRERDAAHLQLERLPRPEDQEELREGVRRQGRGDVLHDHGRGRPEDRVRSRRLRRLLPDRGPGRAADPGQAASAPESRLRAEPEERLAVAPGPLVRQGLAVHGPVHDLDDRDRLPHGQDHEDAAATTRTRTRSTGTSRTAGRRTCWTTAATRRRTCS